MANMSYCRFRNTRKDLLDCLSTLEYLEEDDEQLSEDEFKACKWMFEDILEFLYQVGIVDEEYDDIKEKLEEYLKEVKERSE